MIKKPLSWILAVFVTATFCFSTIETGSCHFIWVAKSRETGRVNIYFGEGPSPDQKQFLAGLKDMKVWSVDENGVATAIEPTMKSEGSDGWFETKTGLSAVDVNCEYGVFGRGDKSMFLHYCAKYIDLNSGKPMKSGGKLPFDVVLHNAGSKPVFQVMLNQKPAAKCELLVIDQDDESHEFKTDEAGKVDFPGEIKGRFQVRAKMMKPESGEVDGTEFSEKRYYCTMIVDAGKGKSEKTEVSIPQEASSKVTCESPFPQMPVGITSFGGAVLGDHVYVFGGHCGNAHEYYDSGQNGQLYRLNVSEPGKWEPVCETVGLQGLAMVAHGDNLYRVGGFKARNSKGEKHDLHSVNEFAKFDFDSKSWKQLEPMPVPRSSLDAVVVGDKLFVVGGWTMKGTEGTEWCKDALMIDLSKEDAKWETIEIPFQRRALSVGFQGDKLYAVGGMRMKGGPTAEVKVYDITSKTWSDGPKLPGSGRMEGFGSSCFNVGGKLVVSTYGGEVLQLDDAGKAWEKIHQLETGRFFHRLLPLKEDKFMLIGGANMDVGKIFDVEVLTFN